MIINVLAFVLLTLVAVGWFLDVRRRHRAHVAVLLRLRMAMRYVYAASQGSAAVARRKTQAAVEALDQVLLEVEPSLAGKHDVDEAAARGGSR